MPVVAVIGGQWGDEGKGKVVDLLAEKADVVARYSGGSNAGHTVINELGEFKLHLVPSGICYPHVDCVIGNGVAINPQVLIDELDGLEGRGVDTSRLHISDRAHLIMPYHLLSDKLEESARGVGAIGTTMQGIGPAYMDKAARRGIRAGDLLDPDTLAKRLSAVLDFKNRIITNVFGVEPLSFDDVYVEYRTHADRLKPYVRETSFMVNEAADRGKTIILEGAQGTMLDIDFGTYPFVTSSPPTAWGACLGVGLSPKKIDKIIGVFKAYTTRVGGGPFPTELHDAIGEELRNRGKEFGTTTGRPRRCGWFDGVAARFSSRLNAYTSVAITKFDILDACPSVKLCTSYQVGDAILSEPPSSIDLLDASQPVYEEMPGWQEPTREVRSLSALPKAAQAYVKRLEEIVGCPVNLVSVGAGREDSIIVEQVL